MNLVEQLREVERLQGDTYSSYEVVGLLARAADEIERLRGIITNVALAIGYDDCPMTIHRE